MVQQMYLSRGDVALQNMYLTYVRDLQNAAPSLIPFIAPINEAVLNADYYGAIKAAAKLLEKGDESFGAMLNP